MLDLLALTLALQDSLSMPRIFSDHMVLQRSRPIPFFGTAKPGSQITVKLDSQFATTATRPDGTWHVTLRPRDAGGPYVLEVSGNGYLRFEDVMVGEVWLASGQSNMEWPIGHQNDIAKARVEAHPNVRMFTVGHNAAETAAKDVEGFWYSANSESVVYMSAVGFWFANDLRKWLDVPIGIINASWGGTPAEAWTRRESLQEHPTLNYLVTEYLAGLSGFPQRKQAYERALAAYRDKAYAKDIGNDGALKGFPASNYPTADWKSVQLPNLIEVTEESQLDGAVWYRRTVDIPSAWQNKQLVVELGTIDEFDDTYFNGRRIGGIDASRAFSYAVPRRYVVAPGLLQPGSNTIAVRVFDQGGPGGFTGAADTMRIFPADGEGTPISLAGAWLSKVERRVSPPNPAEIGLEPERPYGPGHPWAPGSLWNGMVAPYTQFGLRGVIWYQGESNAERAEEYRELFPYLIQDWRRRFGQEEMPFYFVQLANYTARLAIPDGSAWAELREAQAQALRLPKTGMAVAVDLGEANDIHPRNKLEVGRRLALQALNGTYNVEVDPRGPTFRDLTVTGRQAKVRFWFASGLRTLDNQPPRGFAVAGSDAQFYWAQARIEGDTVILSAPQVEKPVAVRYAWANNPDTNLYNSVGLPAEPFRTDTWPGVTAGKRRR